eukprot:Gb_33449 [translate_table: standard]
MIRPTMASAAMGLSSAFTIHSPMEGTASLSLKLPLSKSPVALRPMPMPMPTSPLIPALNRRRIFKIASLVQETPLSPQEISQEVEKKSEAVDKKVQRTESDPLPTTKLYVGNLPWSCDAAEIKQIFQDYGTVQMVEVINDKATGRSRGFAFVTMSTVEDARMAIENLDGIELGGRAIRVTFPEKSSGTIPDRRLGEVDSGDYVDSPHKIYVGNLAWTVNSKSLREFFNTNENVVGAKVIYEPKTGKSHGYGFVAFSSQDDVEAAIASFDGKELEGRPVRVKGKRGRK